MLEKWYVFRNIVKEDSVKTVLHRDGAFKPICNAGYLRYWGLIRGDIVAYTLGEKVESKRKPQEMRKLIWEEIE